MIYIEFYNEFLNTIIGQQKYHIILLIGLLLISTIFKWRFQITFYNDYFLSLTIFFTDQHTFFKYNSSNIYTFVYFRPMPSVVKDTRLRNFCDKIILCTIIYLNYCMTTCIYIYIQSVTTCANKCSGCIYMFTHCHYINYIHVCNKLRCFAFMFVLS